MTNLTHVVTFKRGEEPVLYMDVRCFFQASHAQADKMSKKTAQAFARNFNARRRPCDVGSVVYAAVQA